MNLFYKLRALAISVMLLSPFVPLATVKAQDITYDQYCVGSEIYNEQEFWKILSHNPVGQTFKPEMNRLTSVLLALSGGGNAAKVNLRLIDTSTNTSVAFSSATTGVSAGWVVFNFSSTVNLDTAKTYNVAITTASNNAYWVSTTSGCYANGTAIVDGDVLATQDFGFITYGFNYVVPADPETPAEEPAVTEEPADEVNTGAGTETGEMEDVKIAAVDTTIAKPVLVSVSVNDDKEEVTPDTLITMSAVDTLKLTGTTVAGTKVVVMTGLETHEAEVTSDGNWTLELSGAEIGTTEVLVQGQATKDSLGSENAEFFRVRVSGAVSDTSAKVISVGNEGFAWNMWYTIAAIAFGLALGLGGMFLYVYFRHHRKDQKNKKPTPIAENPDEK